MASMNRLGRRSVGILVGDELLSTRKKRLVFWALEGKGSAKGQERAM